MPTVTEAREIARRWVTESAGADLNVRGAFLHGSATWLGGAAVLPSASDVDVVIVTDAPSPPTWRGKVSAGSVVLDVSSLAIADLATPEHVLAQYHLAGSLRSPSVVYDRDGWLTDINAAVSREFAQRRWVERRIAHAEERVRDNLRALDRPAPLHDKVTSWLFAAGVTTHMLLVAGLRNPTVRTRYVAVGDLLADYGMPDVLPFLLGLLGCANMTRERALLHLDALAAAFDAAADAIRSPFFFASDIGALARPIAIGGSRALVEQDRHREAVFWLVASYARCMAVFAADAPPIVAHRHEPGFRSLLADLGISSSDDLRRGGERIAATLPRIREIASAIVAANPEIDDPGTRPTPARSTPRRES